VKIHLILIVLLYSSCSQIREKNGIDKNSLEKILDGKYLLNDDSKEIISHRVGQTFVFPDSVTIINNNEVNSFNSGLIAKPAKATIVGFISGDCHICIHKLNKWQELIDAGKFMNTQFIFIISTTDIKFFLKVLYPLAKYKGILIIDEKGSINSLNKISIEHIEFNFFLLDKAFKIRLVGDPLIFEELMDLYYEESLNLNRRY